MMAILLFLTLLASLALAGFCAGSETGFLSLNRGRVTHLAREGSKAARILAAALADFPRTVTTLLIGNNLGAVIFSNASAALAARIFHDSPAAQSIWGFCAAMAMLYLGEFMPKLFCAARPLRRMLRLAPAWAVLKAMLGPVSGAMQAVAGIFFKRAVPKEKVTTADLLRILQDRKDGVRLTDFESALISRILVLRKKGRDVTAEEILKALDEE